MPKATPLTLNLILVFTALLLGLRSAPPPAPPPAAPPAVAQAAPAPLAEKPVPAASDEPAPKDEPKVVEKPAVVWPQVSDIAPDPAITFGVLPNGMRYLIQPNSEPPKRVSLRLHIAAGSLMEADDQRGIAHFLEHMVFNGSKHFSAADLVPRMQRLGIGFGAHVNAFTSFDETVYMLDLPDLSAETLELGFTVMRDFADGALLAADEIDKERGVIMAEKVSRDSVSYRLMEQQFAAILPDSLVAKRFPIGIEEVIQNAPRQRFVDFYQRNYTPQRMTFVVVGDVEPAALRQQIETNFTSLDHANQPEVEPNLGTIKSPDGLVTDVFHDKEVSSTEVTLTMVRPHAEKPDTAATRTEDLRLEIAHSILSRRFERISKQAKSPVAEGSASRHVLFNAVDLGSINVTATDDRWQDVVPIIEQEFRRAMQFGFTASELAEAKSNELNNYEQAVRQKAGRKSEAIATAIVRALNDKEVLSSPETDLEIAKRSLDAIDEAACHDAFRTFWQANGYHLILTTKEDLPSAKAELATLFEKSQATPVEATAARATQSFAYTDFGKPGTLASRKEVTDLGISQCVLSNKVRINLKRTNFEQGKIRLLARIGSGKLTQPQDMPMLDDFATAIFEGGGLGKHSNDDLEQILAGRNVGASLAIDEDAFILAGNTTPADFTLECQLMCASLSDPGFREEALWQFQKEIPMIYQQINHTPAGPQRQMEAWLHGNDSRYQLAPATKLASYKIEDAQKWLLPELTKGYLELTVVGDFESDKILPDLLATFGALPARAATLPTMAAARKVKFPNAPAVKKFNYQSKIPQAVALTVWKTAGLRGNQREFRRLNLLASILGDRLREEIREKLGASYSPHAGADGSEALEGMGYILTQSIGKPADLQLLLDTMRNLADQLASKGASDDELQRAMAPALAQLQKSLRDNQYWLNTVVSRCQSDPARLELARTRDADYRSINLKEINALAKKYLAASNALLVSIESAE